MVYILEKQLQLYFLLQNFSDIFLTRSVLINLKRNNFNFEPIGIQHSLIVNSIHFLSAYKKIK